MMKTLIIGAGPIGSLYAYLLHKAGKDVTILARNETFDFIRENGVVVVDEFTGQRDSADVNVVDTLGKDDMYDLVVVAIRKNRLPSILPLLSDNTRISNILFVGNNGSGFLDVLKHLPEEKVLFGFGNAGGGRSQHVVHYVDSEKPGGRRMPMVIGEMYGIEKDRTRKIKAHFESAGIPVEVTKDIDGWLKYHLALVVPIVAALRKNDCDNFALAENKNDLRLCLRATKEAGNVLKALGYRKRQPFKLNLFYWLPEFIVVKVYQKILDSKFAEIAFAMHARAAADEFREHAADFKALAEKASMATPRFDLLRKDIA